MHKKQNFVFLMIFMEEFLSKAPCFSRYENIIAKRRSFLKLVIFSFKSFSFKSEVHVLPIAWFVLVFLSVKSDLVRAIN